MSFNSQVILCTFNQSLKTICIVGCQVIVQPEGLVLGSPGLVPIKLRFVSIFYWALLNPPILALPTDRLVDLTDLTDFTDLDLDQK